jgi:pimeloyl-ACP methyl ester carboxylesterase
MRRVHAKPGLILAVLVALTPAVSSDDSQRLLTIDHYVGVTSGVPAMQGDRAQIYVRERVLAGTVLRVAPLADRVVIFVHGAGTPGSVAFDTPFADDSWMAALAGAGFDVFSLDFTGYGRSTRPGPMQDACNVAADRQSAFVPVPLATPCPATYPHTLTTIASDWTDLAAVVDYVRALRGIDRVHLVAWSLGGPRAGGYAARHPDRVHRLVLLAPAYNRASRAEPPESLPAAGTAMTVQSRADFLANWNRQVECTGQIETEAAEAVWSAMLASDPVGATWGSGVRRAPSTTVWGWNAAVVGRTQTPMLLVAPLLDAQVAPARVRELYEDLGATEKVLLELGCASHNAMWEGNRDILFGATREWLERGTVNGLGSGRLRLGE